ncbi:MAG: hydroxyisourate hydrolase [Calditrichaeota bacterium]|nr:MAG: hydroxyisourate hydrolase [Calditrichota bacterium]MBL1205056.1 hydroxyisourate hydrolase [Calditrichota bacterium]NOG44886.1 hydroxyisourate hydrolase [Calditrichota bacterium]
MSQITTHVLDTSLGRPGQKIKIELQKPDGVNWKTIAQGVTNDDGRISDLLKPDEVLEPGVYKMFFHSGDYFRFMGINTFFPYVEIVFETTDTEHYHVPLLLNPFGYSTYRGS